MTDTRSSRPLAWMQLMRLPNVFTAMADVAMGFLFTHETGAPAGVLMLLLIASSCLYTAGMVLNDVFDVEIDRRERPIRPLPSGRVSLPAARYLGAILLALGVSAGITAALLAGIWWPAAVSIVLACLVVVYDGALKRTPLGPPAMGSCRALNVLLGMSAAPMVWTASNWLVASGIGVYIAGVTWFSRGEAATSCRAALTGALLTMLAGMTLLWWLPRVAPADALSPLLLRRPENWTILWLLLALVIGWRAVRAIVDPRSATVQATVKTGILSLIVLDAVIVFAVRGLAPSIAVLLLLVPAFAVGWWVYST